MTKRIKQKIKRTKRQNKTTDRSNHSIKQIVKLQTLRTKTTLILKPIKTNYKNMDIFRKNCKKDTECTHPTSKNTSLNIKQESEILIYIKIFLLACSVFIIQ